MNLLFIIILILSILGAFSFIFYQFKMGKYNIEGGYLEKIGIEEFKKDYPEKSIEELKIEIEHVASLLMENVESNRYTDRMREKVSHDKRINFIKDEFADSVDIVNYKNKFLKAKVNYIVGKNEYNLILDMRTVNKGRIFLNKYFLLKQRKKEFTLF